MVGAQTRVVAKADLANGFANTDGENYGRHRTGLPSAEHDFGPTNPLQTPSELLRAVATGAAPPNLATLVQKIRSRAYTVTDADIEGLRGQFSDDQLFEIIVAATFGAASERRTAAFRALEEA